MSDVPVLDTTPALAPERAALLTLLRGLSADDWERPSECPAWTVKGVALHILGDDLSLLSRQRDAATDGLTQFAEHHPGMQFRELLDGFNEHWVSAARFLGAPLIVDLLDAVGAWSDAFYGNVGLDTAARESVGFFAQTEPSPYWMLIAREYAERVIHQSQIRRAVGAPELEGEPVTWMARVVVHALAWWLRDLDAPAGATIAMDFGGAGSWTWRREAGHWSVLERVDSPDARVTVTPERVIALLTRAPDAPEVAARLAFGGDTALARSAMNVVAPLLNP